MSGKIVKEVTREPHVCYPPVDYDMLSPFPAWRGNALQAGSWWRCDCGKLWEVKYDCWEPAGLLTRIKARRLEKRETFQIVVTDYEE